MSARLLRSPARKKMRNYSSQTKPRTSQARARTQTAPELTEKHQQTSDTNHIPSTMSATSVTSEVDRAMNSETANDIPPILRLPVELRTIIYDYATIQQEWLPVDLASATHHIPSETLAYFLECAKDPRRKVIFKGLLKDLTPQQRGFLTTQRSDFDAPQLTSSHPLSRVNKQVYAEFSEFLRTSSMPVVATVRNLDFSHVIHFLSTLEKLRQNSFKVGLDGNSERKLTIGLQGPYTASCMNSLRLWIEHVHLFVGPERSAELATLYKIIPVFPDETGTYSSSIPMLVMMGIDKFLGHCAPGGGKIEARKIVQPLYHRFRREYSFCILSSDYENMLDGIQGDLVRRILRGY
jgi:hypothetical protein